MNFSYEGGLFPHPHKPTFFFQSAKKKQKKSQITVFAMNDRGGCRKVFENIPGYSKFKF